jgi:hypothetical protein
MADLGTPTKFSTLWVVGACAAVLIGWDVYAALSPANATISATTLFFSKHPIVPFLAGVLAGHLFWPQVKD